MKRIWGYWSQAMGCLGLIVVTIALLAVGSCQWQDMRTKASIRDHLPAQYRDGEFVFFRQSMSCNGYSFIFKLSHSAAQKLRIDAQAQPPRAHGLWGDMADGLFCLGGHYPYKNLTELKEHVNRPGTHLRKPDSTNGSYEYYIPSLGIIAGGNAP